MPNFNHIQLLADIRQLFKKHGLPVETFEIDFSMKYSDFDRMFPEFVNYEAGYFSRAESIGNTEAAIRGRRRIPFNELTDWILTHIKPRLLQYQAELQREFTNTKILVDHHLQTESAKSIYQYTLTLSLDCTLMNAPKNSKNNAVLSIFVSQRDRASYPKLSAFAGWLTEKESDGWGIHMFSQPLDRLENPTMRTLEKLNTKSLPTSFAMLQRELRKADP